MIVLYFLFAILLSLILALLEIQIEGKDGWAQRLPTWRYYRPWFKYLPGGNKPLTGYHSYLWSLLFIYSHLAFLFTIWSIGKELIILSFLIFVLRLEDFLWFVLNPNYGISKFKRGFISWHKQWLGLLPTQYYISFILWGVLFWLGLKLL